MWKEISYWLGFTSICGSHDSAVIVRFTARNDKQAVLWNESDTTARVLLRQSIVIEIKQLNDRNLFIIYSAVWGN